MLSCYPHFHWAVHLLLKLKKLLKMIEVWFSCEQNTICLVGSVSFEVCLVFVFSRKKSMLTKLAFSVVPQAPIFVIPTYKMQEELFGTLFLSKFFTFRRNVFVFKTLNTLFTEIRDSSLSLFLFLFALFAGRALSKCDIAKWMFSVGVISAILIVHPAYPVDGADNRWQSISIDIN